MAAGLKKDFFDQCSRALIALYVCYFRTYIRLLQVFLLSRPDSSAAAEVCWSAELPACAVRILVSSVSVADFSRDEETCHAFAKVRTLCKILCVRFEWAATRNTVLILLSNTVSAASISSAISGAATIKVKTKAWVSYTEYGAFLADQHPQPSG